MRQTERWLRDYENRKGQGRQLDVSWQSNKYDFSDPNVRLEYVPEMGCSVGGCISEKSYGKVTRLPDGMESHVVTLHGKSETFREIWVLRNRNFRS